MDAETKRTIDGVFSVAITGSFAIPGVGAVVAAFLAAGEFAFDQFVTVDRSAPKPDDHVTKEELKAFAHELSVQMDDINILDYYNNTSTIYNGLLLDWADARDGMTQDQADSRRRLGTLDGWSSLAETDFKLMKSRGDPIKNLIHTAIASKSPIHALPLFVYGVNTFLLLGRMCIMWEFAAIARNYEQALKDNKVDEKTAKALEEAVANGEIDLEAEDDEEAAKSAPESLRPVIEALKPIETISNASVYVKIVHKYLSGSPEVKGYVEHLQDMIDRLDDYYLDARYKHGEIRNGFRQSPRNRKKPGYELKTPVESDWEYTVRTLDGDVQGLVPGLVAGQYLPSIWEDMIDGRLVDGATKPLSLYDYDTREKLRAIHALWRDAELNTNMFLNELNKSDLKRNQVN